MMYPQAGEYRIIRVDGTEEIVLGKATIPVIQAAIGCDCLDVVCLSFDQRTRLPEAVMLVDDTGMIDGKPINPKATALYHAICRPGTTGSIHGDVVVASDRDFP
jgi:hypothetical protein